MIKFNKIPLIRFSLLITTSTIIFGPLYSEPQYSWIKNTVSQLGAQSTKNNWIMIMGFVSLGISLFIKTIYSRKLKLIPFGLFGLFFALSGCFPHQAWIVGRPSHEILHRMHQIMANLSGIAITMGHLGYALTTKQKRERIVSLILAATCVVFPLLMIHFSDFMGIIQKSMYGLTFLWIGTHSNEFNTDH